LLPYILYVVNKDEYINFMAICRTLLDLRRFDSFSRWRPSAILDFKNSNFNVVRFSGSMYIIAQNFVAIGGAVADGYLDVTAGVRECNCCEPHLIS